MVQKKSNVEKSNCYMPECAMLIASAKIPAGKRYNFSSISLNKTFCPTPPPFTHRRFMQRQKTKINKTMLSASPSSVFHTKFRILVLKSK